MKKVLGIALGAGILLTACGSNGSPAVKEESVKFGEMMNKGKQISYYVKNYYGEQTPTKDSEIRYIIKTDNGKVTSYNVEDEITLKDIKDKSDKEIIDLAKKQDKEFMDRRKKEEKNGIKDSLDNDKKSYNFVDESTQKEYDEYSKSADKMLKELDNYEYKEPKERNLKLKVVEDGTGNNTEEERFYVVSHDFGSKEPDEVYDDGSHTYLSYDIGDGTMKIYDQNYAVLSDSDNEDDDEKDFLITPVSDKTEFSKLDEPDSKYVKVVDEDE